MEPRCDAEMTVQCIGATLYETLCCFAVALTYPRLCMHTCCIVHAYTACSCMFVCACAKVCMCACVCIYLRLPSMQECWQACLPCPQRLFGCECVRSVSSWCCCTLSSCVQSVDWAHLAARCRNTQYRCNIDAMIQHRCNIDTTSMQHRYNI